MTIEQVCKQELALTAPLLQSLKWEDPKKYSEWLIQTYHYIKHSTRIIALAGAHFPIDQQSLHNRFMDHTREEKNHELILINDLKALGFHDWEKVKPSLFSLSLYQTQYYWIQHVSPVSVYGYFLYLESLSTEFGPMALARLQKSQKENTYKFLKVHIEEDDGHLDSHYSFVNSLAPERQNEIELNLKQTALLYRGMIQEIANPNALIELRAA